MISTIGCSFRDAFCLKRGEPRAASIVTRRDRPRRTTRNVPRDGRLDETANETSRANDAIFFPDWLAVASVEAVADGGARGVAAFLDGA